MTIFLTVHDGGRESLPDLVARLHVVDAVVSATRRLPEFEPAELVHVPLVETIDRNVAEKSRTSGSGDVTSGSGVHDVPSWRQSMGGTRTGDLKADFPIDRSS